MLYAAFGLMFSLKNIYIQVLYLKQQFIFFNSLKEQIEESYQYKYNSIFCAALGLMFSFKKGSSSNISKASFSQFIIFNRLTHG